MKMRFFTIPMQDSGGATGELNGFLSNHRILTIERHFVADGTNSAWAICVNYLDSAERAAADKRGGGGGRVDYRELLSDSDFAVFAKLRSLRKTLAEQDGVPAYALFTNEQLADMVRKKVTSLNALEQISGVGPARYEEVWRGVPRNLESPGSDGRESRRMVSGPLETDAHQPGGRRGPCEPRGGDLPGRTRKTPSRRCGRILEPAGSEPRRPPSRDPGRVDPGGAGSPVSDPRSQAADRSTPRAFASGCCTTP